VGLPVSSVVWRIAKLAQILLYVELAKINFTGMALIVSPALPIAINALILMVAQFVIVNIICLVVPVGPAPSCHIVLPAQIIVSAPNALARTIGTDLPVKTASVTAKLVIMGRLATLAFPPLQ
jgi:hypothetical protein